MQFFVLYFAWLYYLHPLYSSKLEKLNIIFTIITLLNFIMDYIEEEIGEICKIKRPTNEVNLDSFELKCVIGKGAYAKVLLVRKKDSQ